MKRQLLRRSLYVVATNCIIYWYTIDIVSANLTLLLEANMKINNMNYSLVYVTMLRRIQTLAAMS
jgi:hypothetical protein